MEQGGHPLPQSRVFASEWPWYYRGVRRAAGGRGVVGDGAPGWWTGCSLCAAGAGMVTAATTLRDVFPPNSPGCQWLEAAWASQPFSRVVGPAQHAIGVGVLVGSLVLCMTGVVLLDRSRPRRRSRTP